MTTMSLAECATCRNETLTTARHPDEGAVGSTVIPKGDGHA
jgi:hypothetical protein